MRKLRIGQISPLNLPVPPKKYGGAEKIIYWLCEGLTKKGHKATLFAANDSKVSCNLCPIIEKSLWVSKIKESSPYYAYEMAIIARKAKELKLDILHDHLGSWSLSLYGQTDIPILHTLHVPFKNKDRIWAYQKLNSKLISLSNAQRKPAPRLNYLATVYNGIVVENFPFNEKPKDYFLWVGELSPRKGIFEVIKIAEMTKIKLVLAGRTPPPGQPKDYAFFNKYIAHKLNKGNIIYLGEKTPDDLKKIYKNAIAFLYPLQWEEPFGLTMIESMACGVPVIAFKKGSTPEVIKDKKTGFIIKPFKNGETNYEDFIRAIDNIGKISRKECRKWVEKNFTVEKMIDEYEKLYYKSIGK
ncbi:MAG: glycosyltransferase family 4 protein [Patescibacteria group bacterium]|nr:glycosyltransferase family 4 protein [Patescibacteria group bacterium]